MVGGLERALLHGIELNALHLDLQNRGNVGNGSVLLRLSIFNADFLDVECAVDRCIDIARATSDVDLDIAPSFLFRSRTSGGGDV